MPYDKTDYPASMKNLKEFERLKAIDILNAMIQDGYDESDAIPIAIAQGKEWAKNASNHDKSEVKKKDITKHEKSNSSSAHLSGADVEVSYREEEKQWEVKSKGAKQAEGLYDTKIEAEKRGREIANNRESKLITHKKSEA